MPRILPSQFATATKQILAKRTIMRKIINLKDSKSVHDQVTQTAVSAAKESLQAGNIIALPTDTIYGIAALAQLPNAVDKLYNTKGRRRDNPISICVGDVADLKRQMVFVGIRIPDFPFIREVARACDQPLALTSANKSLALSSLAIDEFQSLWDQLDVIFDGGRISQSGDDQSSRLGSTVINLSVEGYFKIIRKGSAFENTVKLLVNKYGLIELIDSKDN
ncbi:YrdC domain-containing protein, mitochondrial [Trichoplax sp. H2]|nr:YrdC domain-containing protein, mitochondrial [Trichoplax sp. H2]|eukprot:RDD38947.1 YrdC domain-containing protein, mitochondrial [Trichoplax sp. H2]